MEGPPRKGRSGTVTAETCMLDCGRTSTAKSESQAQADSLAGSGVSTRRGATVPSAGDGHGPGHGDRDRDARSTRIMPLAVIRVKLESGFRVKFAGHGPGT
eukprot:431808-Rhodomonas_salina.1